MLLAISQQGGLRTSKMSIEFFYVGLRSKAKSDGRTNKSLSYTKLRVLHTYTYMHTQNIA